MSGYISAKLVSQETGIDKDIVQGVMNEFSTRKGYPVLMLETSRRPSLYRRLKELGFEIKIEEKPKKKKREGRSVSVSISLREYHLVMLREVFGDIGVSECIQNMIEKAYEAKKERSDDKS